MALALATVAGCAGTVTQRTVELQVELVDAMHRYEQVYLLQPGDAIEVFVYRHPELSRRAIIRPDGMITLPLVDDVRAAGKSTAELDAEITATLEERIKRPEVTVIVENPPEPVVYLIGEVGATQTIPLRQAKTVAQALVKGGGVTKMAATRNIAILRVNDQGYLETHTAELPEEGLVGQPDILMAMHNMPLKPNDIVFVPESGRAQLMRLIDDFNKSLTPYMQVRTIQLIEQQIDLNDGIDVNPQIDLTP